MANKIARAFAPATVANVAVGFDILGFALENIGEIAIVEKIESRPEVLIKPITGFETLATDPLKNTATAGLVRLIKEKKFSFGFNVRLKKTIPIGSGLGGSSASAVATIIAANALLTKKLSLDEMLDFALTGEEVASGVRHADNVGPCLYGGLVLVQGHSDFFISKIKTPTSLRCVILLPDISIFTKEARGILSPLVSLPKMVEQSSNLAGFVLGCQTGSLELIKRSLHDVVIEPQRSKLISGFNCLQEAALSAGALGCSISGSGPAIFALAGNDQQALKIKKQFINAAKKENIKVKNTWISPISKKGAHILRLKK